MLTAGERISIVTNKKQDGKEDALIARVGSDAYLPVEVDIRTAFKGMAESIEWSYTARRAMSNANGFGLRKSSRIR